MSALDDLIAAVEAGRYEPYPGRSGPRFNNFCDDWEAAFGARQLPHYGGGWNAHQGSLDAAKALHEALLPGWYWGVSSSDSAYVGRDQHGIYESDIDDNPARAWLLAILRAYRSLQEKPE